MLCTTPGLDETTVELMVEEWREMLYDENVEIISQDQATSAAEVQRGTFASCTSLVWPSQPGKSHCVFVGMFGGLILGGGVGCRNDLLLANGPGEE